MRPQTLAIHTGVSKDSAYNSVMTPIYQTSTFQFEDVGKTKGYDYTRTANPTRTALEENICALEGGILARATASGMLASTTALARSDVSFSSIHFPGVAKYPCPRPSMVTMLWYLDSVSR